MRNPQRVEVMGDGPKEKERVDISHRGVFLGNWYFGVELGSLGQYFWVYFEGNVFSDEALNAVTQFAARRIFI